MKNRHGFRKKNKKQQELVEEALASGDRALIRQRIKEAHERLENSPYGFEYNVLEKGNAVAKRLFGKPFSEMTREDFGEPDSGLSRGVDRSANSGEMKKRHALTTEQVGFA